MSCRQSSCTFKKRILDLFMTIIAKYKEIPFAFHILSWFSFALWFCSPPTPVVSEKCLMSVTAPACRCWQVSGGGDGRVHCAQAVPGARQFRRVCGAVEGPVQDVVHHRRQPDLPLHL